MSRNYASPPPESVRRPPMKPTPKRRLAVYSRDGFRCRHCGWAPEVPAGYDGRHALGDTYTCLRTGRIRVRLLELDHIKPRLHGGTNDVDNLQTLCNSCNARKGARR